MSVKRYPDSMREEAARLRNEEKLLMREIAVRLGVGKATVVRWLNPEADAEYTEKARLRAYRRGVCGACGGPRSKKKPGLCRRCREAIARGEDAEIIRRWNAGEDSFTIGLVLGMDPLQVRWRVDKLRRRKGVALQVRHGGRPTHRGS